MKNPAKPGVSSTNGTRGVVGSGMSETTKRAIPTDLMDLGTRWAERVDATHLIAKPVPYHAARANLRAAEGGAERKTTNSPEEIGGGCAGRKMALTKMSVCAAAILFILASIWAQAGFWIAWDATALCAWVGLFRTVWRRASGGEGV